MDKQRFKEIVEERKAICNKIDEAYTQILYPETRAAGLQALEGLRGKDRAVPVIMGYAHELHYYDSHDKAEALKAIQEYEFAMKIGDYNFLQGYIDKLNEDLQ